MCAFFTSVDDVLFFFSFLQSKLQKNEMFVCVYSDVTGLADGGQRHTMIHAENSCTNPPECRKGAHHIYLVKASDIDLAFLFFANDLLC